MQLGCFLEHKLHRMTPTEAVVFDTNTWETGLKIRLWTETGKQESDAES